MMNLISNTDWHRMMNTSTAIDNLLVSDDGRVAARVMIAVIARSGADATCAQRKWGWRRYFRKCLLKIWRHIRKLEDEPRTTYEAYSCRSYSP